MASITVFSSALALPLRPSKTLTFPSKPLFFPSKTPTSSPLRATSSSSQTAPLPLQHDRAAARPPQWKAAIDFKWIRDNRDLVAENIRKRNSGADLELVLELYEEMGGVQKIAGS